MDTLKSSSPGKESGFFRKLANGDFGLAKTYWLYGVLVGIVVSIISNAITSVGGFVILMLAHMAYSILVIKGTWRAADRYQGPHRWAVLAKIAAVLGAISLVAGLVMVVRLLGQL